MTREERMKLIADVQKRSRLAANKRRGSYKVIPKASPPVNKPLSMSAKIKSTPPKSNKVSISGAINTIKKRKRMLAEAVKM